MDPFIHNIKPFAMQRTRRALRQSGVSQSGARQFLGGMQVGSPEDRLRIAQLLVEVIGGSTTKPAEFKPAEFKPAEFKPAEFKPAEFRAMRR